MHKSMNDFIISQLILLFNPKETPYGNDIIIYPLPPLLIIILLPMLI